jgi:hypothetical protein
LHAEAIRNNAIRPAAAYPAIVLCFYGVPALTLA